ncbi:ATP-utilizing chromatin assembly and remodelling N-terminal-domain-containing protein [Fennellomyces sp. T-0311]|nr:ATP-utilizing chromatin assembly and remodelling N-terminal-domain-containing protein [Fennellomyces sp. T-0311]
MPLLNDKRIPLTPAPPYDPRRKRKEVWYLRFTNEIFTNYEAYINRLMLYHQPIWTCEATGRANLTYEQALESEGRDEHNRAEFRFCEVLRKRILFHVQFQTIRLEPLVEEIYIYYRFNFAIGEIVHCKLGENIYLARILDIFPGFDQRHMNGKAQQQPPITTTSSSSEETESEPDDIPRQPNGRLRFPDAFLHPTPATPVPQHQEPVVPSASDTPPIPTPDAAIPRLDPPVNPSQPLRYRIQLINEYGQPIEDIVRIVEQDEIRRDKRVFCRHMIQRLVRECAQRDSYIGAPWLIKPNVAYHYGISTVLPLHLQEAQDLAYANQARKRKAPLKEPEDKEAEKRARKEENLLQKAKLKEEKERQREERRKQAAVKYPIEDLDLPIYRKDPNLNWALIDMSPDKYTGPAIIPYPSGGRTPRPTPHKNTSIPDDVFETFISVWTFLAVFSDPLELSPFSIDDFERALCQPNQKSNILFESNACLLNVIISERKQDIASEIASGLVTEEYLESMKDEQDDSTKKQQDTAFSRLRREKVERGWRDTEQLKLSNGWDEEEIDLEDRKGWEAVLIGCLNEIATPSLVPDLDLILRHLVPRNNSTASERERQYPSLSIKHKLTILSFLVEAVNESNTIKDYMEQCQEQLTEFRRQKVELNKESKSLAARRVELDRRDRAEKEGKDSTEDESDSAAEDGGDDSDADSNDDSNDEDASADSDDSDSSTRGIKSHERRHRSRQEKLKIKQQKRREMEQLKKEMYAKQREAAKARSQELRQKAEERRKLEEEERALRKKEEQLEKDMRKYMTLRIRPLGRDRFYNRYLYLDNIGTSSTYGTGRLYVQSPSDIDIQMILERDRPDSQPEQPWGRGGGQWFMLALMKAQGMEEESEWLEKRLENQLTGTMTHSWWRSYSDPEEIQKLLSWLNPKGSRECKLKNEISKRHNYIMDSMKRRSQTLTKLESQGTKRNSRSR